MQPRLISYQADSPKLAYVYSKTKICPSPWTVTVAELKANKLHIVANRLFHFQVSDPAGKVL